MAQSYESLALTKPLFWKHKVLDYCCETQHAILCSGSAAQAESSCSHLLVALETLALASQWAVAGGGDRWNRMGRNWAENRVERRVDQGQEEGCNCSSATDILSFLGSLRLVLAVPEAIEQMFLNWRYLGLFPSLKGNMHFSGTLHQLGNFVRIWLLM